MTSSVVFAEIIYESMSYRLRIVRYSFIIITNAQRDNLR